LLIAMIGQLNSIAKTDESLFSGMQVRQASLGLLQSIGAKKLDLCTIHKLHNKNQQLAFADIKNDFISKATIDWYGSLADKK